MVTASLIIENGNVVTHCASLSLGAILAQFDELAVFLLAQVEVGAQRPGSHCSIATIQMDGSEAYKATNSRLPAAGRTTSASAAVGVMNMSITTSRSRFFSPSTMRAVLGKQVTVLLPVTT